MIIYALQAEELTKEDFQGSKVVFLILFFLY